MLLASVEVTAEGAARVYRPPRRVSLGALWVGSEEQSFLGVSQLLYGGFGAGRGGQAATMTTTLSTLNQARQDAKRGAASVATAHSVRLWISTTTRQDRSTLRLISRKATEKVVVLLELSV